VLQVMPLMGLRFIDLFWTAFFTPLTSFTCDIDEKFL
jgi:hypothetical protein